MLITVEQISELLITGNRFTASFSLHLRSSAIPMTNFAWKTFHFSKLLVRLAFFADCYFKWKIVYARDSLSSSWNQTKSVDEICVCLPMFHSIEIVQYLLDVKNSSKHRVVGCLILSRSRLVCFRLSFRNASHNLNKTTIIVLLHKRSWKLVFAQHSLPVNGTTCNQRVATHSCLSMSRANHFHTMRWCERELEGEWVRWRRRKTPKQVLSAHVAIHDSMSHQTAVLQIVLICKSRLISRPMDTKFKRCSRRVFHHVRRRSKAEHRKITEFQFFCSPIRFSFVVSS